MKKIILIEPPQRPNIQKQHAEPPTPYPPLWALCLASHLKAKKNDIPIEILDSQIMPLKNIKKRIIQIRPNFVGISPTFSSYKNTITLAKIAKKVNAKVILGGHHATGLKKEILINRGPYSRDYCVDVIIQHDGEKGFFEYTQEKPIKTIKNLVYQTKNGIQENPVESLDLNKLPEVKRDFVNPEDYFKKFQLANPDSPFKRPINIYSQKGCRWREISKKGCSFCSRMESQLRIRDPRKIVNEIKTLIQKYDIDCLREFSDDFLGISPLWMKEFESEYRKIKNKPMMEICLRADRVNPKTVKFLKNINVCRCALGIESLSNKSLSSMCKGISAEQNKRAIELLAKNKISMSFCFLIGAHGETTESIKETVDFIKQINESSWNKYVLFYNIRLLTPVPNSLYWDWLIARTGKKYLNQDIINTTELRNDWFKYFCSIQPKELPQLLKRILKYPKIIFIFDEYVKNNFSS